MSQSSQLFQRARRVIPGGVNSPVRAFRAVGRQPVFIERAEGCTLVDADGKRYIDYIGSWGPMILGHAHPKVIEAIRAAAGRGTSFGAPTALEVQLAEQVCAAFPNIDSVRMVSSGTEATMSAIRLARGFTGRDRILKFAGGYHGHADSLLVAAGSGLATLGIPASPGVPKDFARHTLTAAYNDLDGVKALVEEHGADLAAIMLEPIAGNMGCVPPEPGFLEGLRRLCDRHNIVLIIDEVMTGFRVAYGGAQQLYGIRGDLVCLGKILGGGLPVGAFGGRRDIMRRLAPDGDIYQAGTLSGNPLAMSAGLATLQLLREEGVYQQLEERSAYLAEGLRQAATASGVTTCLQRVGSMFCCYFQAGPVTNLAEAQASDTEAFAAFFNHMLQHGVHLAPSQFEAGFVSLAHSREQLDRTIEAARRSLRALAPVR